METYWVYLSKLYQLLKTKRHSGVKKKEYLNRTKHDRRVVGEECKLNFISGK